MMNNSTLIACFKKSFFLAGISLFVAGTAYAMLTKQSGLFSLSRLQSLAPILVTGASILSKRPIRKSLFVGGIVIAAATTAAYLSNRDKKVINNE